MKIANRPLIVIAVLCLVLVFSRQTARAGDRITNVCPGVGLQIHSGAFEPGGIILTTFDKNAIWAYNVDNGRRYPLPDTAPCGRNCHLSPDATWLTYFNDPTNTFNRMRLDGSERTLVVENAAEVSWWDASTYLIWTPGKQAYLQPVDSDEREYLNTAAVTSIQPGGRYGVLLEATTNGFRRWLVNLEPFQAANDVDLGADRAYFNAQAWSPDGQRLAYVAPVAVDSDNTRVGGEIFAIHPGDTAPTRLTNLTFHYGAERINGVAVGELSWSPDGTRIAFWVTTITGVDETVNLGRAVVHILDVQSGEIKAYCAYSTDEQTPNPSRLVWSPDGTYLAFAGAIPNDNSGYHLLALHVETGVLTSLSVGVVAALGSPDVIAWGRLPS